MLVRCQAIPDTALHMQPFQFVRTRPLYLVLRLANLSSHTDPHGNLIRKIFSSGFLHDVPAQTARLPLRQLCQA
jgi:hypothetical protein